MITVGAEITTNSNRLERDLRRDARVVESVLGGAFKTVEQIALAPIAAVDKLGSAITGVVGKALSVQNIIRGTAVGLAGAFVLRRIDDAIDQAGALEVRLKGIANQTGFTRREVGRFVADVNDASAGMLDFSVASEVVNRGLLAAIPPQAIERLTRYSAQVAVARGEQDRFNEQLPQLLKTIAGGETGLLKDFGVFIDPEDLKGLEFDERNARILELTLDQLEEKTRKLGTTGREIFFVYQGIFGNIEDIKTSLSGVVLQNETVQKAVRYISELTGGIAATLRRERPGEVIGALFEKVVQVAGALAVDLGEAIGVGITRGIRLALDQFGVRFEDFLPPETAAKINAFADRPFDFDRTRQRAGELRDVVSGPEPEDIASLSGRELRQAQRLLRRLQRERRRGVSRSGRRGEDFDTTDLDAQILGLQRSTGLADGASAADVQRLRYLTRSLDRGEDRRRSVGAVAAVERQLRSNDVIGGLDPEVIRRMAREMVETEREQLSLDLGLGDIRGIRDQVSDSNGTAEGFGTGTGTDRNDSLMQRLGKSFFTGVFTDESTAKIRNKIVGAINEGVIEGLKFAAGYAIEIGTVIGVGAVGIIKSIEWAELGKKLVEGVLGEDWESVGGRIASGIIDSLKAIPGFDVLIGFGEDVADRGIGPASRSLGQEVYENDAFRDTASDFVPGIAGLLQAIDLLRQRSGDIDLRDGEQRPANETDAQRRQRQQSNAEQTSALEDTADSAASIAAPVNALREVMESLAIDVERTANALA